MIKVIENTNSIKQPEEWKSIPGYEGLYEVSNWGRIKSHLYCKSQKTSERILSPGNRRGYYYVELCKGGKVKKRSIHRLVAEAFIPNPSNLPEVNHKDENKENNYFWNLEWCDRSYNNSYGTRMERISKRVVQLDKSGNFVAEYKSIQEAARVTDIAHSSICKCCQRKKGFKSRGGFIWIYKDEYAATQTHQGK